MDGVRAEERLQREGGKLAWEGLYALVLKATGSKAAAERAGRARRMAQMRAGQQPA